MALLFPWATKEYLLWNMTIGQIVLYHNTAMKIRSGEKTSRFDGKSGKELKDMAQKIMADAEKAEREAKERQALRDKYGEIDG